MYERMTNKNVPPETTEIEQYIGTRSCALLKTLEEMLNARYDIVRQLRFPFGPSYGWGYKYAHKTKHLCYLFFEKDAMTVTLQIGDKEAPMLNKILPTMPPTLQSLWEDRYPCGRNGGWVHDRILSEEDVCNLVKLIEVRKKPLCQ